MSDNANFQSPLSQREPYFNSLYSRGQDGKNCMEISVNVHFFRERQLKETQNSLEFPLWHSRLRIQHCHCSGSRPLLWHRAAAVAQVRSTCREHSKKKQKTKTSSILTRNLNFTMIPIQGNRGKLRILKQLLSIF